MNLRDDDLQEYLAQTDAGKPSMVVLAELPVRDKELAPLLAVAAALRELPDPEIDPAAARVQHRKVMMAIQMKAARAVPQPSSNGHLPVAGQIPWRLPRLNIGRTWAALGGVAALVLFFAILLAARFVSPAWLDKDVSTLADVAGVVEVRNADESTWQAVDSGVTLGAGQQIRTGPGSTATLVFFDGTQARLAAGTELTLVTLEGRGETLRVELEQHQGRTRHDVVPLQGDEALYVVRTPGSEATVHGTVFDVRVGENGTAEYGVTEGRVAVNSAGQEVFVGPGQITTTAADAPPAAPMVNTTPQPSLSFAPDEISTAGCEDTFRLMGILMNTATGLNNAAEDISLGYNVIQGAEYVQGVILDPPGWPLLSAGGLSGFYINVAMNDAWDTAPAETEVKVRVFVADEANRPEHHVTRLTATITRLCDVTPTATTTVLPTWTAAPTMTPTLTPTAAGTSSITATPAAIVTGTPPATLEASDDCTGADPHPHGITLANRFGVPYEEIMRWFCSGYGFGEIVIAYELSLSSGTPVADIFALRASGLGWGQIRQQLEARPGGGPPGNPGPPEGNDQSNGSGQPDNPGNSNKPDKPGKPQKPGNGGGGHP